MCFGKLCCHCSRGLCARRPVGNFTSFAKQGFGVALELVACESTSVEYNRNMAFLFIMIDDGITHKFLSLKWCSGMLAGTIRERERDRADTILHFLYLPHFWFKKIMGTSGDVMTCPNTPRSDDEDLLHPFLHSSTLHPTIEWAVTISSPQGAELFHGFNYRFIPCAAIPTHFFCTFKRFKDDLKLSTQICLISVYASRIATYSFNFRQWQHRWGLWGRHQGDS